MGLTREKEGFPRGPEQVKYFFKARSEMIAAAEDYKCGGIQAAILYGLETLVPNEVRESGVLSDPRKRIMVDRLLTYQVRLNDRIDFINTHNPEFADVITELEVKEAEAAAVLVDSLGELNIEKLDILIENAVNEVEVIETSIASRRGNLSFSDIEKYRNVVNAISNCVVTSAILGPRFLKSRLETLEKEDMNWSGIIAKYQWMFSGTPRNNVERTVMIMHALGMAGQIDDDWSGIYIDRWMGVETFASGALAEKKQDPVEAKEFLDGIKKAYLTQARALGLSSLGVLMIDKTQTKMQKVMSSLVGMARYSKSERLKELLRSKIVSKMGLREKIFAQYERKI